MLILDVGNSKIRQEFIDAIETDPRIVVTRLKISSTIFDPVDWIADFKEAIKKKPEATIIVWDNYFGSFHQSVRYVSAFDPNAYLWDVQFNSVRKETTEEHPPSYLGTKIPTPNEPISLFAKRVLGELTQQPEQDWEDVCHQDIND